MTLIQAKETESKVQTLVEKFGYLKVNLCEQNEGSNGEGVWATPVSEEDKSIYENKSSVGETFKVRICNQPIYDGWNTKMWGDEIVAQTNGTSRPYAYKRDNSL